MDKALYDQINQVELTHWWYIARRKIIFDWVLRILKDYPSPKILDVGCGTGFNLVYLREQGYSDIYGVDFTYSALDYCREHHLHNLVCADGTFPPFRTETFDLIMSLDSIEHIEDDVNSLHHLANILSPGGTLFIFTPAFNFLWGLQDEVSHHYRRYTASELREKIAPTGLQITKLTYANTFLFPLIWAGRTWMKLSGNQQPTAEVTSENDLHPAWSNDILQNIFAAERPLLRHMNMPFGVSLLCVAQKPKLK